MPQSAATRYPSIIAIGGIAVKVRLGISERERAHPQEVVVDVRFYLPGPPAAAQDDNAEYICYHSASEKIHALCAEKEYRLIEYLTHEIHRCLRGVVPPEVKIGVKLRKPNIQLPYVKEGASYCFTDLPGDAWVVPE